MSENCNSTWAVVKMQLDLGSRENATQRCAVVYVGIKYIYYIHFIILNMPLKSALKFALKFTVNYSSFIL